MQSFLEEVTLHILENYQDKTGDICIVTPNRRAGLFLRKHFAANVKRAMWAPEILGVEDFIHKLSGLQICDKMGLLFNFFRVYKDLEQEKADDIDSFFSWAPTLLADFDDIDNALAGRHELYSYLSDIRYIDSWNPDGSPLTAFQQEYLAFIRKLETYHNTFASNMIEKGMAWQGLSSRVAAKKLQENELLLPWSKIIFIGFNALTKAEEAIIHSLLREGKAEFLTDSDTFYVADEAHEAGHFIRRYHKKFMLPAAREQRSFYGDFVKKIRLFGIAKNVNQARLAGNLLKNEPDIAFDENTAVVLANEALLIPLLNAMPGRVGEINITMGYPVEKTNMFVFFDSIFQLFLQGVSTQNQGVVSFYHKDLHRLFSLNLTGLLWDAVKGVELTTGLLQSVAASNKGFCSFEELAQMSSQPGAFLSVFHFLETNWQQHTGEIFPSLIKLTGAFDQLFRQQAADRGVDIVQTPFFIDFESLYYFAGIFRRMHDFLVEYPFLSNLKTLYRLFRQVASETRLSFLGEPLQGMQVMGMLETRSLDFKHVVLLSANENILPKPAKTQSFIPFDVKKAYGLRIYQEQDAIFAYHFYRLLQRAENIYIIYNTQSEDTGSSEKSRFLAQLQVELPVFNSKTDIKEEVVSLPPQTGHMEQSIIIPKTPSIMQRLDQIAQKGFSPSALSRYINCPLQFYLEKVASLDESDAIEETMEAATIGSVVHAALQDLYEPYTGTVLQHDHLREMSDRIIESLEKSFRQEYHGGRVSAGKNLLLYHLIKRYIENLLAAEKKFIMQQASDNQYLTILALESTLSGLLKVQRSDGKEVTVLIKGMADRIDRLGNVVRVIDYKTGRIGGSELSFKEWEDPFRKSEKGKNFQLLCYAWMYYKMHPTELQVEPGIISLRAPGQGSQTMKYPGGQGVMSPEQLGFFEDALVKLIGEIMDPALDFGQTDKMDNCKYCTFKSLCGRHQAI